MSIDIEKISNLAKKIRKDILSMTFQAGVNGGHIGGAFSCADIMATLYGAVLHNSPKLVTSQERDQFVLSKGHVALAHYAALAELGYFSKAELKTFEQENSEFPTHEVMNPMKGIEVSSGSLGYGLSIGVGCAIAAKLKNSKHKTYVLIGDGECNEGSIWEAAMSAARFRLDNLTAIVDVNGQSLDGYTEDVMPVCSFADVFQGFGWSVKIIDGHDIQQIYEALKSRAQGQPTVLLAHTLKCKGISSIEGKTGWHHASLSKEQYEQFINEVEDS